MRNRFAGLTSPEAVALGDILRTARVSYQREREGKLRTTGWMNTTETVELLHSDEQARLFLEELEGE